MAKINSEEPDSKDNYLTDTQIQRLQALAAQYGFAEQNTALLIKLTIVEQLERTMVATRDKQRAIIYGKKRKGLIEYIERFQKRLVDFWDECDPADSFASLTAFINAYPPKSEAIRLVQNQKLDSNMTALNHTIFVPDGLPAAKEMGELDTILAAVLDLDKALKAAKIALQTPDKRGRGTSVKDQNERLFKRFSKLCKNNGINLTDEPKSRFVSFLDAYLKFLGITKPTGASMAKLYLDKLKAGNK